MTDRYENIRKVLAECRDIAMEWTLRGRIPECGKFGEIAQDLDYLCDQLGEMEMTDQASRLALSEAMRLHDQRVADAQARVSYHLSQLDDARTELVTVTLSRNEFIRAIKEQAND